MAGSGTRSGERRLGRSRADRGRRRPARRPICEPGDVVLVIGGLGAGKTTFVRGAARALGVEEPVTSPTFTIGQRYSGTVPVSHLDLYRLSGGSGPRGRGSGPARRLPDRRRDRVRRVAGGRGGLHPRPGCDRRAEPCRRRPPRDHDQAAIGAPAVILGFDTATSDTAVAVVDGGSTVHEAIVGPDAGGRPEHGRALLGLIEAAVAESGGWQRIDSIAVGLGPGSFTGLRIGVSTARALAQARALPVAGVASTAALAAGLTDRPDASGRPLIGIVDARRGEIFAAVDRGEGASEPVVCSPDELVRVARRRPRARRWPPARAQYDSGPRSRRPASRSALTKILRIGCRRAGSACLPPRSMLRIVRPTAIWAIWAI